MRPVFSIKGYLIILLLLCSCVHRPPDNRTVVHKELPLDYPITAVSFTHVTWMDNFWKPRIERMFSVTLPHELDELRKTGRDENFRLAAQMIASPGDTATYCTSYPFDDSDLYKVIQGISYLLEIHSDAVLKKRMDSLIRLIAAAQERDGYLYTARTVNPLRPHPWAGSARWANVEKLSHELYCSGHLYQAAAVNYEATGDSLLLKVALCNADLIMKTFGWGKLEKYPGHPEVALGLISLYKITGERKYLNMAKFFLDIRGPGGDPYEQAQQKVVDQRRAIGHAVRAGYLYSAMADVSALTGEDAYLTADQFIWDDIVSSQLYVTGGIGSTSNGEAFGEPFKLPNLTAYNETCASIANVYFNQRMFLNEGNADYYDVLERTLYNALLSGLSLHGDRFFYPNPLESAGQHHRSSWFGCACCPTNLARFIPTVGGYMYATQGDTVFLNLYGANAVAIPIKENTLRLEEHTDYPWSGRISIDVSGGIPDTLTLKLRIPGWARGKPIPGKLYTFSDTSSISYRLSVNGAPIKSSLNHGYAIIKRVWKSGDRIDLTLPMEVHMLRADPRIKEDQGKVALQRGPLVYCLEWRDNVEKHLLDQVMDSTKGFTTTFRPDLLGGVTLIRAQRKITETPRTTHRPDSNETSLTAIPYYTWANRGSGEMTVWVSVGRP